MRSLCGAIPAVRHAVHFMLLFSAFLAITLSGCSSEPVVAGRSLKADSLSESKRREFVAALLLNVKGEHRAAVDRYRALLQSDASSPAINYALSRSFYGIGVSDSARFYSEKSVKLDPSNTYYLRYLAELSHQMTDYTYAAGLYQRLVTLEPGRPENLSLLALEYLSADQPEKALAVFQEILRIDPKNETTQAQVLLLEIKLRHYQNAIGTLNELVEQGNGKEKLRLTLGELYLQTGQYESAFKSFRDVINDNPLYVPAWLALFEVSVQSGNRETFLNDLHRFHLLGRIGADQKIAVARLFLIRSLKDSAYEAPAQVMISELNRHYPRNGSVYLLRGQSLLQRQDAQGAERYFRKARSFVPGNPVIDEALVSAYIMQKAYHKASSIIVRAKKRYPVLAMRFRVMEGDLLYQEGKLDRAVLLLENVMQSINVKTEKDLYLQAAGILALCYDRQGLSVKSIRLYEEVLQLDPGNALAMNNIAYMLAEQGKDLSRAKTLAMKAVAAEPLSASYLDTLGWILYRMGEYDKSRELLEKAAGLNAQEAEIFDHLAQVYDKLGNMQKAAETRDKLRKLKGKP
ncbi:tetratricopeptide repeat protein [Chlorobium sp. BLA1]|uniref:tetratricopeptide repeat protein n=1 Tax=Candidatus Chlorobium masyuteum TaxID=2716876 RepID=UPI0014202095|nr:tetratricopeptide repeat protein [Candidatus Chlorobium masyuteum]NHQ59121.1 tetratricopeptide repeat protein [Candidatus Chlorobium masyuteum]